MAHIADSVPSNQIATGEIKDSQNGGRGESLHTPSLIPFTRLADVLINPSSSHSMAHIADSLPSNQIATGEIKYEPKSREGRNPLHPGQVNLAIKLLNNKRKLVQFLLPSI